MNGNKMRFGTHEFAVKEASFRHITQSWSGPGWDFTFYGDCVNDNTDAPLFPYGARILTEAAPIPLEKSADYTGVEITLPESYDDESGEPFFGFNVMEEHEMSDVRLQFVEREGNRYRIEMTAEVAGTVLGHPERLELSAWVEELPDHAYPV